MAADAWAAVGKISAPGISGPAANQFAAQASSGPISFRRSLSTAPVVITRGHLNQPRSLASRINHGMCVGGSSHALRVALGWDGTDQTERRLSTLSKPDADCS